MGIGLNLATYKTLGIVAIIIIVVGTVYFKISSLNNTIEAKDRLIKEYVKDQENCKLTLALKESNINTLNSALDSYTKKVELLNTKYNNSLKELKEWEAKPPKIKYKYIYKTLTTDKNKISQGDCNEGLELNKQISELKYEDL